MKTRKTADKRKIEIAVAVADLISDRMTAGWSEAMTASNDPATRITGLMLVQLPQIEAMPAIPPSFFRSSFRAKTTNCGNRCFR